MSARRILFLGGTGTISTACVRAAVAAGHDVSVLNRGERRRALPDGVATLQGDVRDGEALRRAIGDDRYDAVADFLSAGARRDGAARGGGPHRAVRLPQLGVGV